MQYRIYRLGDNGMQVEIGSCSAKDHFEALDGLRRGRKGMGVMIEKGKKYQIVDEHGDTCIQFIG